MTFEDLNLNKPLLSALNDLGIIYPTPIQKESFSTILSGRDVIGIAQTGTGKTFAYLLPTLRLMKFSKQGEPRLLIIVPTRELVIQVEEELRKLTAYMSLRVAGVYGGTNIKKHKILVSEGLDVLVGTPGRLLDLAYSRVLRLKSIKQVIIDEVDEMLNLGFRPQLNTLLDLLPEKRQHLMFSATMTEEVEKIIIDFFNRPVKIEVAATGTPLENINQESYRPPNFYTKVNLLKHLIQHDENFTKVLVFVRSKRIADLLFQLIEETLPDQIGIIHSNKSQNFRINSVQGFESGKNRLLIATDLISRGLDFTEVTHVINFDIPDVAEDYMHRIGRSGRAEKQGTAISFISEVETELWEKIETLMDMKVEETPLPETIEISTELIEAERIKPRMKNYLPEATIKDSQGAFHEKKEKNQKVNLGSSYYLKKKARKPAKRSGRKKKK